VVQLLLPHAELIMRWHLVLLVVVVMLLLLLLCRHLPTLQRQPQVQLFQA
jgi:hypothetical protein